MKVGTQSNNDIVYTNCYYQQVVWTKVSTQTIDCSYVKTKTKTKATCDKRNQEQQISQNRSHKISQMHYAHIRPHGLAFTRRGCFSTKFAHSFLSHLCLSCLPEPFTCTFFFSPINFSRHICSFLARTVLFCLHRPFTYISLLYKPSFWHFSFSHTLSVPRSRKMLAFWAGWKSCIYAQR